jgi:superfamily II helicase
VDLTFYFKEYLEKTYKFRIIGKTTNEIIEELRVINALEHYLIEIKKWLTECDRFKFTGIIITSDEKRSHFNELLKIAEKIEGIN